MKLCISTLVCPTWTFQQIVDACAAAGVSGIDFRGIASEIDVTRLPQFTTEVPETLRVLGEKNLRLPCYNLSTTLVTLDDVRWQSFLDETHRYARLAQQTFTKYLRVFGGVVPRDITRDGARDLARRHLSQLSKIASAHDCQVILETHDDWSTSDEVLELVADFSPDEVGVLWDIEHPHRKGESPEATATKLGKYIRHVHVKDSKRTTERPVPTLLGDGDVPIDAAIAALRTIGYTGWYALETEKRWRAESPDPERSIPQFVQYMTPRLR